MRARDMMLFVICVSVAAPIVLTMGIYSGGPVGTDVNAIEYVSISLAVGLLSGGGISALSFNVRIPSILIVYSAMYIGSVSMMSTLILQMVQPFDVAVTVSGVMVTLAGIIGVLGAMEISGGPHGGME